MWFPQILQENNVFGNIWVKIKGKSTMGSKKNFVFVSGKTESNKGGSAKIMFSKEEEFHNSNIQRKKSHVENHI